MDRKTKRLKAPAVSVLGLFEDERSANRAVDEFQRRGIVREKMSVMTSVPQPEGTFGTDPRPSRLPFFSAFGALGGLLAGLALAAGTALLYPIATGGKPIVALPTVGVITYELTMLGIILLTLVGVLYEMKLPRVKKPAYDARVSDGYIGVLVPCQAENQVAEYQEALRIAGAVDTKSFTGNVEK